RATIRAAVDLEGAPMILAAQHHAAVADNHHAAIIEQITVGQSGFQRVIAASQHNRFPAVAEVGRTEQMPAQSEGNDKPRLIAADYTEQRTLIRRLDSLPALPHVCRAEHASPFPEFGRASW